MEALEGLDLAYNDLGRVCDGGSLDGFTPTLEGVGDTLSPEERQFAGWMESLSESAKRFTAATSRYLKAHGGGGAVGQYCADKQMIQFCDYAVDNWKDIDKASQIIKQREAALMVQGKMKDLDSTAATLGVNFVAPVKRVSNNKTVLHGISDIYAGDMADRLDRSVEYDLMGVPLNGLGNVDDSYIDSMSDSEVLQTAGVLGMISIDNGEVTVDLGRLGVAGLQDVIRMPQQVFLMDCLAVEGLDGPRWWNKFKSWAKRTTNKVKSGFKRAGQWVKRTVKKAAQKVKHAARHVASKVKQAAKWVKDKSKGMFQAVGNAFKKTVTFVKDGVTYLWDKTKGFFKKVGNTIVRIAKAVWEKTKELAKKIGQALKKWGKRLNPKNIIARCVIIRKTKKGEYGIAKGAYYGMIGRGEAAKLGVTGKEFENSKVAYEKLCAKWEDLGGKRSALDKAIRMGQGKFNGRMPKSAEEIRQGVKAEGRNLNQTQLVAEEKAAVLREEGVKGLGELVTAIVTLVVAIISAIVALVKSIIQYLKNKQAQKDLQKAQAEEQQQQQADLQKANAESAKVEKETEAIEAKVRAMDAQAATPPAFREIRKTPDGKYHVVDKRNGAVVAANVSKEQAEALTASASSGQGIVKQKASMGRVAMLGAAAVAALFIVSKLRS